MRRLLTLLASLMFASTAAATTLPVVRAVRLQHPLNVDGQLDEAVWQRTLQRLPLLRGLSVLYLLAWIPWVMGWALPLGASLAAVRYIAMEAAYFVPRDDIPAGTAINPAPLALAVAIAVAVGVRAANCTTPVPILIREVWLASHVA